MKRIAIAAGLVFFAGCGGASRHVKMDAAYAPPPEEPMPAQAPAGEMSAGSVDYDYSPEGRTEYRFNDDVVESQLIADERPSKKSRSEERFEPPASVSTSDGFGATTASAASTPPPPSPPPAAGNGKIDTKNEPMIIYSGYLQLRIKRLIEAQDQIQEVVEKRGGYIDSLTNTTVVVRIPGNDFEAVMDELAALGDLLNRWVRAEDVTDQFTDLRARLEVALKSRERLLRLLDKTENVAERLRILQEIKRLSEQIDTIDSSLAAIRNLVDYFTITIDLVPILENERVDTGLSPFAWVRALTPHLQSLSEGQKAFVVKLPRGFVLFDKEDAFRAQSADTSVIRAATVENEPLGDEAFWIDAVDFEMTTRQEKIVQNGKAGRFVFRLYENDDVTSRFYLVALTTVQDRIYVIEAFFPNAAAKDTHLNGVIDMLKSAEVKP